MSPRALLLAVAIAIAGGGMAAWFMARPPATPTESTTQTQHRVESPLRQSIAKATAFLLANRTAADGTWRSDVYGQFKDGTALTPLVAVTLLEVDTPDALAARKAAAGWLAKFARADGSIEEGPDRITFPLYTAALAVKLLSHPEHAEHRAARDAWLNYLFSRQLTEANGWEHADKQYGGWGYYPFVPKKSKPGELVPAQQLLESNLSATLFALDAICTATENFPDDDPQKPKLRDVGLAAWTFLSRRQNYTADATDWDDAFDDGGFAFIYDDPVRNKAGIAGTDKHGRTRFHSYGSATADGLRALRLAWQLTGNSRFGYQDREDAARNWLVKRFSATEHPGTYTPALAPNRDAVYFYYAASATKALAQSKVREIEGVHWAESFSDALLARQQADGSWANEVELVRENDPILATCYAIQALSTCLRNLPR